MEANSCGRTEDLLKTIQLQCDQIQQCLEHSQKQNRQIELLNRQLTDTLRQKLYAEQQLKQHQQQQQQQSRDCDVTQLKSSTSTSSSSFSLPVAHLNGSATTELSCRSTPDDAERRISQFEVELRETKAKLEESERQRVLSDEQAEKSRQSYESEISWLKMQLATFEEDFNAERRAHVATTSSLETLRSELATAQRQFHQHSLQQMQDLSQRREAALDFHRREHERTHPQNSQSSSLRTPNNQQQRYQSDSSNQLRFLSDDEGEDEID